MKSHCSNLPHFRLPTNKWTCHWPMIRIVSHRLLVRPLGCLLLQFAASWPHTVQVRLQWSSSARWPITTMPAVSFPLSFYSTRMIIGIQARQCKPHTSQLCAIACQVPELASIPVGGCGYRHSSGGVTPGSTVKRKLGQVNLNEKCLVLKLWSESDLRLKDWNFQLEIIRRLGTQCSCYSFGFSRDQWLHRQYTHWVLLDKTDSVCHTVL